MKLTTLLILVLNLTVSAAAYSQNTKFNFSMKDVTIEKALLEIENSSRFIFIYESGTFDKSIHRTISAEDESIEVILDQLFDGTDVGYAIDDRQISLYKKSGFDDQAQISQSLTISGTITDKDGQPLPGVAVVVKGTTNGTITDFNGNYTIFKVPSDGVLQLSFVGMKLKEVPVEGKSTISVTMEEDAIGIEEVVAVGYGIQKRSNITGSIASVDAKALNKVPATNTTSMLTGRLPGLYVKSTSGQPGRDEASFSIRGFGDALVIVDGVPRDFQQLDPNEIESVSILKDASAAIYGARAGNGVVLVTTKKGSRGTKPRINYTGNFSLQRPTFMHDMADAVGYASYFKQAEELAGVPYEDLRYNNEDIEKYRAGTEPGYKGADWQDIVFRDWAPQQQHNINVSGGTDKVNYFLSAGALDQQSILSTGSGTYKRYNITSVLMFKNYVH